MSTSVKEAMRALVETLPDECTWDDVMYGVYVRQTIQRGLDDVQAGGLIDHEEVFRELIQIDDE